MSAGEFVPVIYETDAGNFCLARCQPQTAEAVIDGTTNASGAGPVNQEASAILGGTSRQTGVIARRVTLEFTGTLPTDYSGDPVTIPAFTPAFYNAAARGRTGTYLGSAVRVVGRSPERVN